MSETDRDMEDLDRMLDAARRETHAPNAALTARVLDDADRVQAQRAGIGARARTRVLPALAQSIAQALGGWRGLGGLAAACAVGIWLGFSTSADLSDPLWSLAQMQDDLDVLGDGIWPAVVISEEG